MAPARLEHVNFTVADPDRTARMLGELFGWKVRWSGAAINGGYSVHVGSEETYLAIYTHTAAAAPSDDSYETRGGLNHIGIVVDDLDAAEERVKAHGYAPKNHADYEPGRRFYFDDENGVEFEVVSYA